MSLRNVHRLLGAAGAVSVLVASCVASSSYLFGFPPEGASTGPLFIHNTEHLRASVMFAYGKGLTNPCHADAAVIQQFLIQQIPTLTYAQLPDDMRTEELDNFQLDHRYLLYFVGMVWRWFGVSWFVYRVLLVCFFCLTGLIVYSLFRLGMHPLLSAGFAISSVAAASFYTEIEDLRDFSTAPFVLGAIVLMGCLIKRPVSRRVFWAVATLLGLVTGIGLGFRLDQLICVVPALVVLLFCKRPGRHALLDKIVAGALFLSAFAAPAYPVLFPEKGPGTELWHHVMMGMSNTCAHDLKIGTASYEWIYALQDGLVQAVADNHRRRVYPSMKATDDLQHETQLFVRDMAKIFPGDLIARAYATCLWIMENRPVHLGKLGVIAAVAAAVIMAGRSTRQAFLFIFILLYFCGYGSIQFQLRHIFHLACLPLWNCGFLFDQGLRRLVPARLSSWFWNETGPREPVSWRPAIRRAAVFGLGCVVLLCGALSAARAWQYFQVKNLANLCAAAPVIPVEANRTELTESLVCFSMRNEDLMDKIVTAPDPRFPFLPARYYVAEFASSPKTRCCLLDYESVNNGIDFSGIATLPPSGPDNLGKVRFFFPVYGSFTSEQWNRFRGITVPRSLAADFRGFYRVTDLAPFPVLVDVALPDDMRYFRYWRSIVGELKPAYESVEVAARERITSLGGFAELAKQPPETAARKVKSSADLASLALAYADRDNQADALTIFRQGLAATQTLPYFYFSMDDYWRKHHDLDAPVAEWKAFAESHPSLPRPWYHLGVALEAKGEHTRAAEAYRKCAELRPEIAPLLGGRL